MMKKVPVRRCTACGKQDAKGTLLRVARSPEGAVALDLKGKAPGRGAYVCASASCLDAAVRKGRLEHTLKVRLSTEDRARLLATIQAALEKAGHSNEEEEHGEKSRFTVKA